MDRYGSFDSDNAHDAAIEAPPAIGTDERRMHVRAYNYWVSLLDGRAYPSIEDLDTEHQDFAGNSVLLDFSTGAENPSISFLGDALRDECEIEKHINTIADVPSRSLLSRLTDHYLQIIANRAPIGFEAEYVNHRGNNTMYRGILMPFSSDDDTIDFIYGVINWKEVADAETTQEIHDSLRRELDAPVPREEAHTPAPAYADGPSASFGASSFESDVTEEGPLELSKQFEPDGSEGLADWLAAARDCAAIVGTAEMRSRTALYRALSIAYDFALTAETNKSEYQQLLDDSGITGQDRAPMTPIVKLVFGVDYEKTRLAEYAAVLTYAKKIGVGKGGLEARLESFDGGIKGFVNASRAERRPLKMPVSEASADYQKVRDLPTLGEVDLPGDSEFVLLVARRVDDGRVAVIGKPCFDQKLLGRALDILNR